MDNLKGFFSKFINIPQKDLDQLLNLAEIVEFKKNDIIEKPRTYAKYFYIIKSGFVKSYTTDSKGKVFMRTIFTPFMSTGPFSSLVSGTLNQLTYQCLTSTILYKICFEDFKELVNKNHNISLLYNSVLENIFLIMEDRIYELSNLNATERYLKLKKEIPIVDSLMPQFQIASYLNVTAVQLSRIRRELFQK